MIATRPAPAASAQLKVPNVDSVNVDGIGVPNHSASVWPAIDVRSSTQPLQIQFTENSQHLSGVHKTLLENSGIGLVGPSPRFGSFPRPAVGVRNTCPIPFRRICLRPKVGASIFAAHECFGRPAAAVRSTIELHPFRSWFIGNSGSASGPVFRIPSIGRSRVHPAELAAQPHGAPLHCPLL